MNEQQLAGFLDNVPKMGIYGVPKPLRGSLSRLMLQHWYNTYHERFETVDNLIDTVDREAIVIMMQSYKQAPFMNLLLRSQYDKVINRHR